MDNIKETTEKIIKKIISYRLIYYIAAIVLFTITYYVDFKKRLISENLTEGNHLKYFLIVAMASAIVTLILVIFSKIIYKKLKPHLAYIIFALILAGIYMFVVPLCAQSDEPAHLYRTFQVARGEIISPKNEDGFITKIPKSVVDMVQVDSKTRWREYKRYYNIKEMMKIELNEDETVEIATVGNYHGISYLPQVIGVKIGLVLKLRPYFIAMLGRMTSVVITVLLLTWGIKKLPKHKLFASIVLLCPVVLTTAASYSADNMTLASIFLMLSYVLYYIQTKEKIKKQDYVVLAVLTFVVAISKMAYIPVIGILLFIPKECFEKEKIKPIISSIFILLGILSAIWWMKTSGISATTGDASNTNTWIYSNPLSYLVVLFRSIINDCYDYVENMFAGHFLCHNQVRPYAIVPLTYLVIVIMSFFSDENKEKTTFVQRFITTGIIALCYVIIATAMYVYNTAYKDSLIIGVQGRYFIPLLLLAVLFGNSKKLDIKEERLVNVAIIANYAVYLAMITKFLIV